MSSKLLSLFAIAACGLALSPAPLFAQEEPKKPEMEEEGTRERPDTTKPRKRKGQGQRKRMNPRQLVEQLGLNPEQASKLQAAYREMAQKLRDARQSGKARKARRELMQGFQRQLGDILSPEQMDKYRELRGAGAMGRGRGQAGRQQPGGASQEALLDSVRQALVLSEQEDKELMPLVEKVLKLRADDKQATAKERVAFLAFLKQGAPAEEVKTRLDGFRAARKGRREALEKTVAALTPKLDQERTAKLVAFGVLD